MSLEHDREDFSKFQHESIRKIIKYENSKLKKFNQILAGPGKNFRLSSDKTKIYTLTKGLSVSKTDLNGFPLNLFKFEEL